jgi:membrane associated rhomboid family serine protease
LIPLRNNIPNKSFPLINWALIAINFYFFYIELRISSTAGLDSFIAHWAVVPRLLFANPSHHAITLITAAFLHGGWLHIISNMLFLHIFGDSVEDRMGHVRYLLFYLLVGAMANGAQAYFTPTSAIPLIGASGAIAGVLGAYFFYYPYSEVETLIPIFFFITIRSIPAFIFLGYWFILQTLNSTFSITSMASGHTMGGVAFLAHAAGFVSGLILGPAFGKKSGRFR